MGFGNLKNDAGLAALNTFLEDKSYIDGYVPSQADVVVFGNVSAAPACKYAHALRWYNNINSYKSSFESLPGVKQSMDNYGPKTVENGAADDSDDDDVDLFGSTDEEEDAEVEKIRQERLAQYAKKKSTKPGPIAKSMIILDCKPWDDETDMAEMEKKVRAIEMDGLLWGTSKLVPVGYGIKKLQISMVVEDLKVSVDDVQEMICGFEDHVQSVDIAAFNKV